MLILTIHALSFFPPYKNVLDKNVEAEICRKSKKNALRMLEAQIQIIRTQSQMDVG